MIRPRGNWHRGPDGTLLAVLLLVLGGTGILAYQAWDAARSHRRVTEATLRDYATFATWELRRRVESSANAALNAALTPVLFRSLDTGPTSESEMVAFAQTVEYALGACGCARAVSAHFILDVEPLDLQLRDATMSAEFQEWLTGDFLELARAAVDRAQPRPVVRVQGPPAALDGGRRMVMMGTYLPGDVLIAEPPVPLDSARVVVYRGVQRGETTSVFGFVVDVPEFVRPLIEAAVGGPPLLPTSLAGTVHNDDVLVATLWLTEGDTLFRTDDRVPAGAEVVDTFRLATGPLAARMAVRPEMAGRLVIGGLPRSRVPILLGSVGLTLALLLVALVQLRRQQELYRLRGDFVSGVSHELRTPLAQIRLFSDLLASGRLGEVQRQRSMRILTDETKRLTYLVENVLRFSRAERRTERVAPAPINVDVFLQEVVGDFEPLAHSRGARIDLDCPAGLRALLDADAMRQVMLNLLDNAVKYGPRGQTIGVRACPVGDRLRIEVDDEGPGIPPAERERIWEPYRRLSREVERATGGSGIGLAVVQELVALHGGHTSVTDGARGGSRFVLLLPLGTAETAPAVDGAGVGAREDSDG
jgi:signal transduction histidine kinase